VKLPAHERATQTEQSYVRCSSNHLSIIQKFANHPSSVPTGNYTVARSDFIFLSLAAADQGKCATGMTKKLSRFSRQSTTLHRWDGVCQIPEQTNADVPVAVIRNTGQSVVPSQERGQKTEKATGLDEP